MKKILLAALILTGTLPAAAQRHKSWYSSVTDRYYAVTAESIKGKHFDCLLYGKSLNQHIPTAGLRVAKKDLPAFVKELRSFADQAGEWFETKAPVTGIEDPGLVFKTNFKKVMAWYDMGTPPEPEYHLMDNAPVEAFTQMEFVGEGAVYLGVLPVVDKNGNRHPGVVLPFASKQEIESLITAIESLNLNAVELNCAYCEVDLKKGEAHKKDCPYYIDTEVNDTLTSQSLKPESPSAPQPIDDIRITCPQCGATFVGKSASLFMKDPRNHEKGCPIFNKVIQVPQVPSSPNK